METLVTGLLKREDRQYQIPLYQRAYSWEAKDWRTLWADVHEQFEGLAEETAGSAHFLGAVVLVPSVQDQASFNRFVVVDGQQRLVTLSLALAALRDVCREQAPDRADRIHKQYLVNSYSRGDDQLRILPTQDDRPAYRRIILGVADGEGERGGISTAYEFFLEQTRSLHREYGEAMYEELEKALTVRLLLVDVTCEQGENPHRIFASLNGKGKPLAQADLVRNHVFMLLAGRAERTYDLHWKALGHLRSDSARLESLMWLKLVLDGDRESRRLNLYTDQVSWFDQRGSTEAVAEAYVVALVRLAPIYELVLRPETEKHPEVRDRLRRLDGWGAIAAHPAIMVLLVARADGQLDDHGVVEGLRLVESFLVRRALAGQNTSGLDKIFQSVPAQLAERDLPIVEGLHQLLSMRRRRWPNDRELREAMRVNSFYESAGRGGIQRRFVLRSLEESFLHAEPVDFETGKFSIEHVMPQTPTAEWLSNLGDPTREESAKEVHRRLVDTIGNLTLTAENARLSNHVFDRKKRLYETSHLELNREIAAAPVWDEDAILARADRLAERAIKLWPAPVAPPDGSDIPIKFRVMHEKLALMPSGTWTTYKDLAELCRSSPMAVASHLKAAEIVPNPHRVLQANGLVAPGFVDGEGRTADDVPAMLLADGVKLDDKGRAHSTGRLTATDLAML